jgi:hypothetical protein
MRVVYMDTLSDLGLGRDRQTTLWLSRSAQ